MKYRVTFAADMHDWLIILISSCHERIVFLFTYTKIEWEWDVMGQSHNQIEYVPYVSSSLVGDRLTHVWYVLVAYAKIQFSKTYTYLQRIIRVCHRHQLTMLMSCTPSIVTFKSQQSV